MRAEAAGRKLRAEDTHRLDVWYECIDSALYEPWLSQTEARVLSVHRSVGQPGSNDFGEAVCMELGTVAKRIAFANSSRAFRNTFANMTNGTGMVCKWILFANGFLICKSICKWFLFANGFLICKWVRIAF